MRYFKAEYIGFKKRTRGTETSQYPEERKSTETPKVVASEMGPGDQCVRTGTVWKDWPQRVTAPYRQEALTY